MPRYTNFMLDIIHCLEYIWHHGVLAVYTTPFFKLLVIITLTRVLLYLHFWQLLGSNQGTLWILGQCTNSADETSTQRKWWTDCVNKTGEDKWHGFMYEEEDQLGADIELPSPWRSPYYQYIELHVYYTSFCGCNKMAVKATARICWRASRWKDNSKEITTRKKKKS